MRSIKVSQIPSTQITVNDKSQQKLIDFENLPIWALDIGCSGYIPFQWERLGTNLKYYGVDPLTSEIQRLSLLYPQHKFLDCYIRCEGCTGQPDYGTTRFFNRTSAFKDIENGFDLVKTNFNSGNQVAYSNNIYRPQEIIKEFKIECLDLLKIDVDGDDFAILNGFLDDKSFSNSILAFEIESQFHGDSGKYGNTFENILRLARNNDYHLYKLESYTYSRSAKPKPYVFDFPAQTHGGQILWGDALFIKDALEESDLIRIFKLIKLYDIYGLDDCAQEAIDFHDLSFLNERPQFQEEKLGNSSKLGLKKNIFPRLIRKYFD